MHKIDLIALSDAPPTAEKVVTIGFFDGLHLGHRHIIARLREEAERRGALSTVVSFVRHPLSQIRPEAAPLQLCTSDEKLELLRQLGVDECVLLHFDADFSRLSAHEFMRQILRQRLGATALLVGYDHRFGRPQANEGLAQYIGYGAEMGIEVIGCDEYGECRVSSSIVRLLIGEGAVADAARLLARPHSLQGVVVRGFQNGRKLGFPTANLMLNSERKVLPAIGVYATLVEIEGETFGAMTNIGHRPTLNNGTQLSIESFVFDFEGDLYERHIALHFIERLRDEQRFDNLEGLAQQLHLDEAHARECLRLYLNSHVSPC